MQNGVIAAADVVDHIVPHRGDQSLFWDESNWQALCKRHHDIKTSTEERGRIDRAVDVDGWPIDRRHHWNAPKRP